MARFPQGYTAVNRRASNAGERLVLEQLKRCLSDDYTVWHDLPVGPKSLQPDVVIFHPRRGLLILEVKHWARGAVRGGNRDEMSLDTPDGPTTVAHPLAQARRYAMELNDVLRRDAALQFGPGAFQGKSRVPYGWGCVLSKLRAKDVAGTDFEEVFPSSRTMLRDELDAEFDAELLERKLWGMQMLTFPCTLSLPECDRVRWHLFPEIRLPTQAGLFQSDETNEEPLVPNLLQVMDVYQERVARTLGEGHRVIHGPAGSGKTMILIFRAQHLANAARPDHPVLVLCYNRALARHIDAALRHRGVDERVVVYTFHAWCETLVRTYQIAVTTPRNHPDYFDALAQSVIRAVDMGLVPDGQYLSLLVDEAHDFDDAWLRVAARMVSAKTRSLLVLYDDAQSIYRKGRRRINFSKLGIEAARRRTSILKINYRNTAEILTLAMRCAEGWLTEQVECEDAPPRVVPASAGRHGPQPVLIRAADVVEEAALLEQRIARALSDGLSPSDILVLARERAQLTPLTHRLRQRGIPIQSLAFDDARGIDFRESAVRLMTLHGSKGLECAWVAILGLQAMPNRHASLEDEARLLYVGMTRATQQLVLAASGESAMVARVRQALEGIGALRPELPFAVSLD